MTKKVDIWMPFLIDKYLGDTTDLNTEQHGAYFLLLMSMWKKGGTLPNVDSQLCTITGLAPSKWRAYRALLLGFFIEVDGRLTQKRLSFELANANKRSAAKAEAGAKGAAKRWQSDDEADGKQDGTANGTAIAKGKQKVSQTGASISVPTISSLRSDSEPDGSVATAANATAAPKKPRAKVKLKEPAPSSATWDAYANAYEARWGVMPVRNATVNGQLANFVQRVPAEEAPAIAAFFVGHRGNLYVAAKHPVNLLVRDAEKLRTDWATNDRAGSSRNDETAHHRQQRETHAALSGGRAASHTAPGTPPAKPIGPTQEVLDAIPTDLLG